MTKLHYINKFRYGLMLSVVFLFLLVLDGQTLRIETLFFASINALFFPFALHSYNRFIGNRLSFKNEIFISFMTLLPMYICWSLSILVAPLGLLCQYLKPPKTP